VWLGCFPANKNFFLKEYVKKLVGIIPIKYYFRFLFFVQRFWMFSTHLLDLIKDDTSSNLRKFDFSDEIRIVCGLLLCIALHF
jgi:hypothetical protein